MPPLGRKFKIKLESGRVLGPLDLERVQKLIKKKHITGNEVAKVYPDGEWVKITEIEEISEILLALILGTLNPSAEKPTSSAQAPQVLPGATQILPLKAKGDLTVEVQSEKSIPPLEVSDFIGLNKARRSFQANESQTEVSIDPPSLTRQTERPEQKDEISFYPLVRRNPIAEAATVLFQRSEKNKNLPGRPKMSLGDWVKSTGIAVALGVLSYDLFFKEQPKSLTQWVPIRPVMPISQNQQDPQKSAALYSDAMKLYVQDTVPGYQQAAAYLRTAASFDGGNVKALAMLASSYLNLIDSSNKDENYFQVISKLIEMSRAKNLDLPETVVADVEYYIFANKPEAAQSRIVEYTKVHPVFGREMFYYLALAFYYRGDYPSAIRYLNQIPENQAFSAKVFYLRGELAEKFEQPGEAVQEYERAIRHNPKHARSHLKIAEVLNHQGQLKAATSHLEFLVGNPRSLSPHEMAKAYYLHSILSQINQQWDIALGDMERAVQLDKGNSDYLLEMYTLRSKAGDRKPAMQANGRMYSFLTEGERLLRAGKIHDALTQFLLAKQANPKSPIPLVKIGDMFARLHELQNARINYRMAAELASTNIEIWSKYIDVLIQSFEWDEAKRAMDKFRSLPVPQSAIDKAAADMYAKQGRYSEAIQYYQKAMARDSIDPTVYLAYAHSLKALQKYKDAPFFYALALRFDPLNSAGIIGTAQCVAATESIDRAITLLQDELQKDSIHKAEILAGIAEFQIQKGEWDQAQKIVNQAMLADPDYAFPWKLQAQIQLNKEGSDKTALDQALHSFQSYSDRNSSDPSGYLERYKIFIKKTDFEKAGEELDKIFATYPKYPHLHYYKGVLYSVMRNHQQAILEYQTELKSNPSSIMTLKGLAKEYVDAGAPSEALKHLSRAMELNPKDPEAKADAGYANFLLKNYAGAIGLYRAALVYDPANPILYKRLGLAYRAAGDASAAAGAFRKYIEMEPDATDRADFENDRPRN